MGLLGKLLRRRGSDKKTTEEIEIEKIIRKYPRRERKHLRRLHRDYKEGIILSIENIHKK